MTKLLLVIEKLFIAGVLILFPVESSKVRAVWAGEQKGKASESAKNMITQELRFFFISSLLVMVFGNKSSLILSTFYAKLLEF